MRKNTSFQRNPSNKCRKNKVSLFAAPNEAMDLGMIMTPTLKPPGEELMETAGRTAQAADSQKELLRAGCPNRTSVCL